MRRILLVIALVLAVVAVVAAFGSGHVFGLGTIVWICGAVLALAVGLLV